MHMPIPANVKTPRRTHDWLRDADDFYVEPPWCSARLFEEELFEGTIWDPSCGLGRIVRSAKDAGYSVRASDIVFRQSSDDEIDALKCVSDIRECRHGSDNVVSNPPFRAVPEFAQLALKLARRKVALVFPTARLHAAHWLLSAPLRRIWLLSPRPPMPPGWYLAAGHKAEGGRVDFSWLIFEHGFTGEPELRWLHRGDAQ